MRSKTREGSNQNYTACGRMNIRKSPPTTSEHVPNATRHFSGSPQGPRLERTQENAQRSEPRKWKSQSSHRSPYSLGSNVFLFPNSRGAEFPMEPHAFIAEIYRRM